MEIMNNLKKWIRNSAYTRTSKHVNPGIIILLIFVLLISYCLVRKEPEKVWNLRGKIVLLAKSLAGLPYRYGGHEIDGFDCSGFVYYVYDSFGIKLPRTAKKQAMLKEKIKLKRAQPADILVFKIKRRWHTAIYTGGNSFIHAPNKRNRVRKESLEKFWKKRLKYVIKIIEE
jgi:hypothetical protein